MNNHAIEKLERQALGLGQRIDTVLEDPANLPDAWEFIVERYCDLNDRIAAARSALLGKSPSEQGGLNASPTLTPFRPLHASTALRRFEPAGTQRA